jgi:hypothetical protein
LKVKLTGGKATPDMSGMDVGWDGLGFAGSSEAGAPAKQNNCSTVEQVACKP